MSSPDAKLALFFAVWDSRGGGGTECVNRVTLGRKAGGVLDSSDVIGVGQRSRVQNDVGHSPENFEFREPPDPTRCSRCCPPFALKIVC